MEWTDVLLKGVLPTFITLIGFCYGLIKLLLKSQNKMIEQKFSNVSLMIQNIKEDLNSTKSNNSLLSVHIDEMIKDIHGKLENIRNRWEDKHDNFLSDFLKIDTTRDNKLRACFRSIDEIKDVISNLRPSLSAKLTEGLSNLKIDLETEMKKVIEDKINAKQPGSI